jgi:transglutaminase-like putative cysteine protease
MNAAPPLMLDETSRRWAIGSAALCLLPLLLQMPGMLGWMIGLGGAALTIAAWRRPLPAALRLLLTFVVIALVLSSFSFRFGRDTGCALLAAMLALKPTETARPRDARSLIGFALFAPFATFLLDEGPASLALGLVAALFALAALQRITELESGDSRYALPLGARLRGVAHLALVGLPMAIVAFWLFPRLGTPLWGVPGRAAASTGLSDTMEPGQWLDLFLDDEPAMRVHFFGPIPPQEQMYWRGPVMWNFDGQTWTQPEWTHDLPPAKVLSSSLRWDYEMEIEPTDNVQLVALDMPVAVPEHTRMGMDHDLHANEPLSSVTRWRMTSSPPRRYEAELRGYFREAALALPAGFNPRALEMAQQWRREAGPDNDKAIVDRALAWINEDFAYTLETPPWGRNAVDEFLFDTKAGFCQHFSSSFVVLMRGAGIPARVVTGYAGGYLNTLGNYYVVRRSDAHAWTEVWLRGRGWVRIDPTAAVAPERIYDTLADREPGAGGMLGGVLGGLGPRAWSIGDWLRRSWNDVLLGFDASRQERLFKPLGIERLLSRDLIVLFGLFAVLAVLWMVWLSARGLREADPVVRAWRRLGRRYRRHGLEREPHEPAQEWTERVTLKHPELGAALAGLSDRFVAWRYAEPQPGQRGSDKIRRELVRDLRRHRPRLLGGRP